MTETPAAPRFTHAREPRQLLSAAQRAATIARDDAADRRVVPHSARGAITTSVVLGKRAVPLTTFGASPLDAPEPAGHPPASAGRADPGPGAPRNRKRRT